MNKKLSYSLYILCIALALPVFGDAPDNALHQTGIYSVVEKGGFDPTITVGGMKAEGDLGIGGFVGMDGELIEINGTVYRVTSDGTVTIPGDDEEITYMNTVQFHPEQWINLTGPMNLTGIIAEINKTFPEPDHIYAVRIDGTFSSVEVRSLPGQQKPYPPLAAVVANQSIFNRNKSSGTIVGFCFPDWMKGVDVAGYHLHFLSDDKKTGGHLFDCEILKGTAMIDQVHSFHIDDTLIHEP
jgi:acetolactate decarboxylase